MLTQALTGTVGLAKLQGLMKDIGLADKPEAYNTSLALYFVGYVLFEIPANMVCVCPTAPDC